MLHFSNNVKNSKINIKKFLYNNYSNQIILNIYIK